jgi:hypothetical protein
VDGMFQDMQRLVKMESDIFECLDLAGEVGLSTADGQAAYLMAMERLDRVSELKADHIYAPLAGDPATRDYVSHLDGHLLGLMARIDILRTHVDLAIAANCVDTPEAAESLRRLHRQLQIRFRREAALLPIFETWRERHTATEAFKVQLSILCH